MASASGQVGGLQLQAGSSGGGFRIRAGGASHRGHQSGRAYDASSFDGAAFFECDELVGAGSKRKRKRRVLCVTASDVLTLVEVTERGGRGRGRGGSGGGGGGGGGGSSSSSSSSRARNGASCSSSSSGGGGGVMLHVKSKVPLRNIGSIAFKDRHNVSLDLTAAALRRTRPRAPLGRSAGHAIIDSAPLRPFADAGCASSCWGSGE